MMRAREIKSVTKQALTVVVSVMMAGCASNGTPIPAPQSEAALLFADKCGECHAVPHPARHSADDWPHYVALMEQRMRERDIALLTQAQRQLILSYLSEYGR